ncbi:MAG: type II secretion system major pseudopilin GspG [Candidatus Omnitrophica bacterium]|nr:type II secretion system major pseudopilin GspG [Candidatus Omnitrophota bacterium]MDD5552676.1 type II secretion system major pseudopilin GspG [Candidatus Omnitrophota bacterium]
MRKNAFTLIELMLVVIIIGVLSAMVMPRLVGRSEQARMAAAGADINGNIAIALDMFQLDTGEYPEKLEDLRQNPGRDAWKGPYLKKDPKDPWGRQYKYELVSSGAEGEYKLCSDGADEADSGDDLCNE